MYTPKSQIDTIMDTIDWPSVNKMIRLLATKPIDEVDLNIEKEETRKRIAFMIDSQLQELRCKNWYFKTETIPSNELHPRSTLQVFFAPLQTTYRFCRELYTASAIVCAKDPEWTTLQQLLYKAVEKENYELAQIIKNRMQEIIDIPKT